MKNWEEAYEIFINEENEGKYKEAKNRKVISAHTKKVHDNLPMVENLKKYKGKLQEELKELKKVKAKLEKNIENKEKYEKQKSLLEEKMKKYSKEINEIDKRKKEIKIKLEDSRLSEEDREKLEEEQLKLNKKSESLFESRNRNNKLFIQNDKKIENTYEILNKKDIKKIDEEIFEIKSKISKCNFIAGKLMEGYDLESDFIREKLTKNWVDKRFKSKEPIPGTKASEEKITDEKVFEEKEYEPIWSDSELKKKAEQISEDPAKVPEEHLDKDSVYLEDSKKLPIEEKTFEEAFPRLSKILPKFIKESKLGKSMLNAKQNKELKKMEELAPKKEPIKVPEKVKVPEEVETQEKQPKEDKRTARNEFVESLQHDYNELLRVANGKMLDSQKDKLSELKEHAIKREEANKGKSQEQKLAETEASVDIEKYLKRLQEEKDDEIEI